MNVTVIQVQQQASLVEYIADGSSRRAIVPTDCVRITDGKKEGWVSDEEIEMAIPYGVPFDELVLTVSGLLLAEELHNSGVWTTSDIEANPDMVINAIRAVLRLAYDDVRQFARSHS